MTNITLSIDDNVYRKMKKYSEVRWSEFVRKIIENRIEELEKIGSQKNRESVFTMLASEEILKKDWENKLDNRWNDI